MKDPTLSTRSEGGKGSVTGYDFDREGSPMFQIAVKIEHNARGLIVTWRECLPILTILGEERK